MSVYLKSGHQCITKPLLHFPPPFILGIMKSFISWLHSSYQLPMARYYIISNKCTGWPSWTATTFEVPQSCQTAQFSAAQAELDRQWKNQMVLQGDQSPWFPYSVAINLGSSPACGLLLQIATAQAGQGNSPNGLQHNIGIKVTGHPVLHSNVRFTLLLFITI